MNFDPEKMDCELYIGSECSLDELEQRVAAECASTDGIKPDIHFGTIEAKDYIVHVGNNSYRNDGTYQRTFEEFLFAPYIVEIYPRREFRLDDRIAFIERIATAVSGIPAEVVAACDYEDSLPERLTLHSPNQ
jgi:hypothetical protein